MLRYTTVDAIALRLRGRLEINQGITSPAFGQNLGAKQVQYELYELVGAQVEAKLDMGLGMKYVLPIPGEAHQSRKILASIVEKFVVAEIMATHYQQTQNAQLGGDMGYGAVLFKQAKEECQALGINFPGLPPQPSTPFSHPELMVLPGVEKIGEIPNVVSRSYSQVAQRNPGKAAAIDWDTNCQHRRNEKLL